MGSFLGHVLPGTLFLILGVDWLIMSIIYHLKYNAQKQNASKLKRESISFLKLKQDHMLNRKSWIPQPCCPRIPLEPIIKVSLASIGIIAEYFFDYKKGYLVLTTYTAFRKDDSFNSQGKLHHITMYSAFLLSGVIDLASLCFKLPKHVNQFFFSVAFWIEGMLFYFHTGGQEHIKVQAHFILTLIIFFCVLMALLRMIESSNTFINIGLACGVLLQGTWFIQVAFALFPPNGKPWAERSADEGDIQDEEHSSYHNAIMFLSACFAWHVMCILIFALLSWAILSCVIHSRAAFPRHTLHLKRNPNLEWMDNEEAKLISVDSDNVATPNVNVELHDMKETAT